MMEIVKIPFVLDSIDGIEESLCTAIGPMRCGDLTSDPSIFLFCPISAPAILGKASFGCILVTESDAFALGSMVVMSEGCQ